MAIKPLSNEKELLQKIAAGDHRAFSELFRAYHESIANYVFTLLESVQLCEEVVLDVFVKVWENRSGLPALENFTAYLFILTRNATISCVRKLVSDKKQLQRYVQELTLAYDEEPNDMSDDYRALLSKAIESLPPSQQQVLAWRQQGLKTREIAEKMSISTDSVKKYQQWAAKAVSQFLKKQGNLL